MKWKSSESASNVIAITYKILKSMSVTADYAFCCRCFHFQIKYNLYNLGLTFDVL